MTDALDLHRDRCWVVAELSANHGGSLDRAIETLEASARAGADAVKIQTYRPDTITIDCDAEPFQIRTGPWAGRTLYDLYEEAHTPWEWHEGLFMAAAKIGVPLFSTPFDTTAVDLLEGLGAPAYKIASFELIDPYLIARVAETRKPLIMSTGMATVDEIADAVAVVRGVWGQDDPGLALLHCVSSYPADPADMHLTTIRELAARFGVIPGLSDHTLGTATAVAGVALGARIIEKHVTMRRDDGGPDGSFSLEPDELARLVADVRTAEAALGEPHIGPLPSEAHSRVHRRSVFVVANVSAGERLTVDNIRIIRPGGGVAPKRYAELLGRRAARDLARGTPLSESDIEP